MHRFHPRDHRPRDNQRGRLVVVQILMMSLFITLFGRLWYLQISSGESYQAQAAENAVRDVIVQPQRGLIVDDMGRPLVANRQAWVVTIDRTTLGKLDPDRADALLRQVASTTGVPYADIAARTKLCGDPGSKEGACWNGSPYQPVPVAEDVPRSVAITIAERGEDFPGVTAELQNLRTYPSPYGVNAAHVLGYLTPITADEYDQALTDSDPTLNAASLVGRSGLESTYDRWLRGIPGSNGLAVDSMGRVIGQQDRLAPRPGDTLVTSIDARVQAKVERELRTTILNARRTVDPVSGRRYKASSGAAVVMDPNTGRIVAMASWPTYDPDVWVGGISNDQLKQLYSKQANEPLLSRPTQAQLAPGSTWKPMMAAGALSHGFSRDTELECSSSFRVGNRDFNNFESGAYGYIGFDKAMQISCNTFFYRVGYEMWLRAGGDSAGVNADSFLADMAKSFGLGSETGIDLPGEASGRVADPRWKQSYYEAMKGYYCKVAKKDGSDYLHVFAREFCVDGYEYRAGDAVNFVIGQGDTIITPLQLALAYSALSNGGTVYTPRVGKAIVSPDGQLVRRIKPQVVRHVPVSKKNMKYIDTALKGTPVSGTMAWKMIGFPLDKVHIRAKTGTAEVYGKQTTSWVATYDENYVVVMMVEQGGTGSGTSGDSIRRIWESLYGIDGLSVDGDQGLLPHAIEPPDLPRFRADGVIDPPPSTEPDVRTNNRSKKGRR